MPIRGKAEIAEDQAPIGKRVERHRDDHDDQRPARPLERRHERAQHDVAVERQHRPLQPAHVDARLLGQRRVLPHAGEDRLGVPQDQPDRDADQHGDPQALPDRPADIAHRMAVAAELGRHHRRRCVHQAEPEDQRREIEVGAERAGGEHAGAGAAHHHDVGRRHRDLGEVGQNHRPAQRERRANLVTPRGFRRLRAGFDRRHFPVFQIANRSNRPISSSCRAANPWIQAAARQLLTQNA